MYRIIKVDTVYGVEAESREGSYDNHRGFLRGFIKGDVGLYSLGKRVILRMDFCISYPSYAFVDFCEVWVKVKVSARVGVGESKQKWIVKDIGDGSYTVAYAMCALMLVPAYCLRRSSKPKSWSLTYTKSLHISEQGRLLVFEYMPNGTLCNHLHTLPWSISRLNWAIRLRIALDCVRALEFLHEHTIPSVIHSNFKYTNIMVSDFGFAKIRPEKLNGLISPRVLGTTGYLAPESVIYVSLWTIN
ncbi:probable serine/threonine-protein kinase PBL7 [Tanacetum coccineum]